MVGKKLAECSSRVCVCLREAKGLRETTDGEIGFFSFFVFLYK